MAESNDATEMRTGVLVELAGDDETAGKKTLMHEEVNVIALLNRLISEIFFPNPDSAYASFSPLRRIKASVSKNVPLLREASRNTGRDVLMWAGSGSPLRGLLVFSVGTITFLALSGLLIFMLLFLAATINAIVISLLMSLVVAGSFLAFFLAFLVAIYIGILSVAICVISTVTISAIITALFATGWIGFFLVLLLATKKGMGFAKHSLNKSGSAISAYLSAWHSRQSHEPYRVSD